MEKWREDLYESNYLVHYGIPGQRKGYTHGHRNGKDVAMTEYENGSQPSAASRMFNVNKGFSTNSGNGIRPARANGARLVSPQRKAIANPMNEKEFKTRTPNIQNKAIAKPMNEKEFNQNSVSNKQSGKDDSREEYFWERDNKPSERTIYTQQLSGNGHNKNFNNFSQTSKTGLKYSGSKRAGTQYTSSGQQYISTKEIVDPKRKRRGREE